jgi:hypothetical protein
MMLSYGKIFVASLLLLQFAACNVYSEDLLPVKIQAALLFKTIGYIKDPAQVSSDGKILIGIIFDDNMASKSYAKSIMDAVLLAKAANYKVCNSELEPVLMEYKNEETLLGNFNIKKIRVLYVITQNEQYVGGIIKCTQQAKVLSVTGLKPGESVKKGISIVFAMVDGKPAVFANDKSIQNEGKEFTKDFYSLVKAVK